MAYIFIRGRQDAIEVDQADAIKVKGYLESGSPPSTVISFKDSSWKLAEIKGVSLDPKEQEDQFQKILAVYKDNRNDFYNLPVEEKAKKSIPHFEIYYWSMTGEMPSVEWKQLALAKITTFFAEYPKWTVPSMTIYKDMKIPVKEQSEEWQELGVRTLVNTEFNEAKLAGHIT